MPHFNVICMYILLLHLILERAQTRNLSLEKHILQQIQDNRLYKVMVILTYLIITVVCSVLILRISQVMIIMTFASFQHEKISQYSVMDPDKRW